MTHLVNKILHLLGYELRKLTDWSLAGIKNEKPGGFAGYIAITEGMISLEEASLLYELAKGIQKGCILEIGAYRGRSTVALGRGSLDGFHVPVYAIEPHEEYEGLLGGKFGASDRAAFFQAMLDTSCYKVVRLVNLSSEVAARGWDKNIGMLWIDGDHSYEGVKMDFEAWSQHLTEDALIVFDDSTDTELGPARLIRELIKSGNYQMQRKAGKISILTRRK